MNIYCTDDYPREGCTLTIKVRDVGPGISRYSMIVRNPFGTQIEAYRANKPQTIGDMVREWCEGRAPAKRNYLD